jgi:ribosomal protein L11 methyltransferase
VEDRVVIRRGDLATGVLQEFDVVVANILAGVVIELMPELPRVLAPGGRFVCSGFVEKHAARVEQALSAAGHRIIQRIQVEDWITLVSAAESS